MNVIQPLIELQDVDGIIRDLEREEKDIPCRKAQENARLQGVNSTLDIAKKQLLAVQKRIQSDEAEAASLRERIQELKIAQATITSNKELQQSVMQVENLEHQAEGAENRALASQEDEIPRLEKRVHAAEQAVQKARGGVNGYVEDLDGRLAEVKERLAELRSDRQQKADAVKRINPKFLLYYERLSASRWPVVVPLSADGVCEGCHMKQPPFVAQLVDHNTAAVVNGKEQQLATCTMCGRLLYGDL